MVVRLSLVALAAVLAAAGLPAATPPSRTGDASVPSSWMSAVSSSIRSGEYHLSSAAGSVGAGWTAPNRTQDLRAHWQAGSLVVTPRVAGDAWAFRYELATLGHAGTAEPLALTSEAVSAGRIEWGRDDGIREWYVNDARGIEQGFEIATRPAGDGPLVIAGAISGLLAYPAEDGESVLLRTSAGAGVLRIAQLVARDANGATLPACFVVGPGELSIAVDDAGAAYPIGIDPLMTSLAWMAESDQADAGFGNSVSTAGDVNGDGYSDVVVGAPGYDNGENGEGRAYLYLGSASGLSSTAAWTAESNNPSARFGRSVATAGDVNGDGYSDVIVGAPQYSNVEVSEGAAYVYLGSTAGLSTTAAWVYESDIADTGLGISAGTAGDVNADGYSDVIIGAYFYSNDQAGEGRAYVFDGSSSGLAATPDWTVEGNQGQCYLGYSVGTAGDVNGDGYSDVIVASEHYDHPENNEGRVFVYHGSAAGLPATADWSAEGNQADAFFGLSVGTAGDVNGDGYADVVVGAPQFDNGEMDEGRAYVYEGSPSGLSATVAWTAEADQAIGQLGTWVGTAGDVNGDGYADVLVGASTYSNGESAEGRVFLYRGSASGLSPAAAWTAEGDQARAAFGSSVATAGDVNGDGWSDVIVGAINYDDGETNEGAAFVYEGSASGLAGTSAWTADSAQPDAQFGYSVATAGDTNGDGYSDVVVGAPFYDNGEVDEGGAFAFLGSPTGLATTPAWTAEGDQTTALFGYCVASAGDVNGDGYSDLVVGAPYFDNGEAREGRASVFAGSRAGLGAAPAWTAEVDQAGAQFGRSVATAGDVNGDGYSDVVVGAPFYDDGQVDEGGVFVYAGSPAGLVSTATWAEETDSADAIFGWSVATAGDVNGDGYSDVVVGTANAGRVSVYSGSSRGLASTPAWTADGDQPDSAFGSSVATAGDVDGDGYSDVIVGAFLHDGAVAGVGRAYVYSGSRGGLGPAPAWTAEGDQVFQRFGWSVATAGDVNADGYADAIVGAPSYDNGQTNEGGAFVYLGSASGLAATAAWHAEADQVDAGLGNAVATGGDVDGDGYSDAIVGASGFDRPGPDEGAAFLYYGNDGDGLDRIPRQRRADESAPIDVLGLGDETTGFHVHARARSPYGRDKVRLEAEVEPLGTPFDGASLLTTPYTDTGAPGAGGSFADLDVASGPLAPGPHHWRVRLRGTFPFPWQSHWMSLPYNCMTETDLRVAGSGVACGEPSALDVFPGAAPLLVAKAPTPDTVALTWEDVGAPLYHVYGGQIADMRPARPAPEQVACGVATNAAVVPAVGPGRWFVVVASCAGFESSYGRDSFGRERDHAAVPCP